MSARWTRCTAVCIAIAATPAALVQSAIEESPSENGPCQIAMTVKVMRSRILVTNRIGMAGQFRRRMAVPARRASATMTTNSGSASSLPMKP
ncbi:hypothetical protein BN961_02403 [Afipia felis]|uniref:Secreted protein n=1 Tax=Afipia felis TaxID=1035 RepID=A0A090MRZ6_AFIFE|nr:hypothetical protein BN961_02403 [Afipia felis]